MKRWMGPLVIAGFFAAGCGEAGKVEPPKRLLAAGTKFSGVVSGIEKYVIQAEDNSKYAVDYAASGILELTLPKGVFAEATFPAKVTYSVARKDGRRLAGEVDFARARIDKELHFTVHQTTKPDSSLSGFLAEIDGATIIDLENFSVAVTSTEKNVVSRTVYLGGQLSPIKSNE